MMIAALTSCYCSDTGYNITAAVLLLAAVSNWPLFRDFHGENFEDFHLESNGCLDISRHQLSLFLPANQRRHLKCSSVSRSIILYFSILLYFSTLDAFS